MGNCLIVLFLTFRMSWRSSLSLVPAGGNISSLTPLSCEFKLFQEKDQQFSPSLPKHLPFLPRPWMGRKMQEQSQKQEISKEGWSQHWDLLCKVLLKQPGGMPSWQGERNKRSEKTSQRWRVECGQQPPGGLSGENKTDLTEAVCVETHFWLITFHEFYASQC